MEHGVLIDRDLLDIISIVLEKYNPALCEDLQKEITLIAPEAVIPIEKAHDCHICPIDDCPQYGWGTESCPQITKGEIK